MERLVTYLGKAFVVSSVYLSAIVLGGFFILRIFDLDNHAPPRLVIRLLQATFVLALNIVVASAIIIPGLKFIHKQKIRRPTDIAATTLLIGLMLIFAHGLYVKLRTCAYVGSPDWHCQVEGGSHIGMIVLATFLSSTVGCAAWVVQKRTKKPPHHNPSN